MKKIDSKKLRIIWCSIITSGLLIPTVAVSAIAWSPEIKPINKNKIILNTKPVNGTLFLNQDENLPVLSVEAKVDNPNAQLAYQWYENNSNSTTNGKAIPGATQSTYTIPKSYTQKKGTKYFYTIISTIVENNIVNSVISSISTLTIIDKIPEITITSEPTNQNVFINPTQNLPTFSVSATTNNTNQKLVYQWYSNTTNSNTNGTEIFGAINSSYTVTPTSIPTTGTTYYYVKISGTINGIKLNPITSNTATLTVNQFPLITISSNPQNLEAVTFQQTDRPTFFVDVNDIQGAQLKYQWYSNINDSNNNGNLIRGATGSSYTIPYSDVLRTEKKYYYVKINGTFDGRSLSPVVSNVSTLIINSVPRVTIISEPQNLVGILGQKENRPTFSVRVKEIKGARFEYQWYKNNNYIPGANFSSYTVPESDL